MNLNYAVIAEIFAAFDKTIEEFIENENLPFELDSERNKFLYDRQYILTKNEQNSNLCVYKGCNQKGVKSHTIQKSASLSAIAENNHVLTPGFNFKKGIFDLLLTGINEASTFTGFCQKHEQLFALFEEKKEFKSDMDFRLQVYRTICREIIINENVIRQHKYRLTQYLQFRNEKFHQLVTEKIRHLESNNIKLGNISYKHQGGIETFIKKQIENLEASLNKFLYPFHEKTLNDISKEKIQRIYIDCIVIDIVIPCCLAGGFNFRIGNKKIGFMIVNILPSENQTYFILATPVRHKNWIDQYVKAISCHPLSLISTAEKWMMYGSDHWFIKPSVWNNLSDQIKQNVINNILSFENKIPQSDLLIFSQLSEEIKTITIN